MRHDQLVAYLVGTAVAGSVLVFPYAIRPLFALIVPGLGGVQVPFFLLPVVWGLWNALHVRAAPTMDLGAWGAMLGVALGLLLNVFLYVEGTWFAAATMVPMFLPVVYLLLWRFVVGPLNATLGV